MFCLPSRPWTGSLVFLAARDGRFAGSRLRGCCDVVVVSVPRLREIFRPVPALTKIMTAALSTAEFPARQVFHFSPRIVFSSDFDSGNLARVERDEGSPGASGYAGTFNIWTLRDNESGERPGKCDSWFYFSVRGLEADSRIRINLMKFKQKNLFNQGWVPVFRTTQSQSKTFSRLRDKPKLRMDSVSGPVILLLVQLTNYYLAAIH